MSASIFNVVKTVKPYADKFRKSDGGIIKFMRISEINFYPIKSLKGISTDKAVVEDRGLRFDRRWMLVDTDNRFMTQREHPKMATIKVAVDDSGLKVESDGKEPLFIPTVSGTEPNELETVTVWSSTVKAAVHSDNVNQWFSGVLNFDCRLVAMTESSNRHVDPDYAKRPEDTVSFADGYPFLLIGQASLDDLNKRISEKNAGSTGLQPLPMNRFRPNFVVSGSEAFEEDSWKRIRIGETIFHLVKPCGRCIITTTDQQTGQRNGDEPLATLSGYRKMDGKLLFGQNLIAETSGATIRTGDQLEVLEVR